MIIKIHKDMSFVCLQRKLCKQLTQWYDLLTYKIKLLVFFFISLLPYTLDNDKNVGHFIKKNELLISTTI